MGHIRLPDAVVIPAANAAGNDDSDDSSPPTPVTKATQGVETPGGTITAPGVPGGYQRLKDGADDADPMAGMDEGEIAALMV